MSIQIEISEEQAAAYNTAYQAALALVRPNIFIDGERTSGAPGWWTRRKLTRGIALFEQALHIAPFKWECRFWIGKALQRLGDHQDAFRWFIDAKTQASDNHSVAKEAAAEALELGDFATGIALLQGALALRPADAVLHCDLAIHQLLSGDPHGARTSLLRAGELESHRKPRRLTTYVERIIAGVEPCPETVAQSPHIA